MSNSLFEHDFQVDLEPNENTYCTQDIQYQYINDNNQMNYSNGYINFTNLNLGGGSIDKMYSFSNAYITIPYSIILSGDGTASGFKFKANDTSNSYAASLKGSHCVVDWVSTKIDGVQLNRSSYHNHLMMNEKIKTYNNDKYKIYGDIMGHAWDNGHAIALSSVYGECNNTLSVPVTSGTNVTIGLAPFNMPNTGHMERCRKNNIDVTKRTNSSLNSFLYKDDSINIGLRDTCNQNVLVFSDVNNLVFQGVACIPLSQLCDVFEKFPTVSGVQGFELRLQCNIARENSYTMTYPAILNGDDRIQPSSLVVVQSIGKICPIMVAFPSGTGVSGLRANENLTAGKTIKATCLIGWNVTGLLAGSPSFSGTPGNACRIHVPAISFTSDYIKDIANAPQYSLKYNDYYVDSELNVKHDQTPSRLFNCNLSRPRTLYIIPFLAAKSGTYPSALTSPFSSAPTTCTPCRLKNFNIQIGGQNVYSESQAFNYNFYNSSAMSILADINGNSPKGALFSSQINKSQWENGYNIFYVNLEKVSDLISDSTMKAFQLTYALEGNNQDLIAYDMYYIISYENELILDRITAKISGINQ